MNKDFKIINYTLFIIDALLLFSSYLHIYDFSFTRLTVCSLLIFILLILSFYQMRKKNKIINDKKYNIMFILTNIIVLIIILRDMYDPMIPLKSVQNFDVSNSTTNGLFIDYNTVYISIMYGGILLYNLINKEGKKKKQSM